MAHDRGHGAEWRLVFKLGAEDVDQLWEVLSALVETVPVSAIRDKGEYGLNCEVAFRLQINGRTADVITVWHYDREDAPPTLVTAYPKL